jgi:aldose 1-epimerase
MTCGTTLVSLRLPDRNGRFDDVILCFDDLAGYLGTHPYFGVIVGRYANRIAKGKFTLNSVTYALSRNNTTATAFTGGSRGLTMNEAL